MKPLIFMFSCLLVLPTFCRAQEFPYAQAEEFLFSRSLERHYLDLSEYPMKRVSPPAPPVMSAHPDKPADTVRIAANLYCTLSFSCQEKRVYSQEFYTLENAPEDEIYYQYYGKVSVVQNQKPIFQQDSVLSVGSIDYVPKIDKLIIACVTDQSADNLDVITVYAILDLKTHECEKISTLNSMQACFTDDGKYLIYVDGGDLFRYDMETKRTKYLVSLCNADPSILDNIITFDLSYHDNILTISLYGNWVEQYDEPLLQYTITGIEM